MHAQSSKQPKADGIFRHLYTLRSPVYYAGRPDQYWALRLASTLRHQITVFPGAPHGYYLVPDGQNKGGQEIFAFFKGDNVMKALDDLRQAREPQRDTHIAETARRPTASSSSSLRGPHPRPGPSPAATARPQAGSHPSTIPTWGHPGAASHSGINPQYIGAFVNLPEPPLAQPPSVQSPYPPDIIGNRDRNTLTPLAQTRAFSDSARDSMYVMEITLNHSRIPGMFGTRYSLVIDTGAATLWFFENGFLRFELVDDVPRNLGHWPDLTRIDSLGPLTEMERAAALHASYKTTVPSPANIARTDYDIGFERYEDSGAVLLKCYKTLTSAAHRIAALLPTWDWESRRVGTVPLELPRVLAYAANDTLVSQPWDGNLGLAFPRSNAFTFNSKEPSTFYDAISGDHRADEPTRLTIRLLHPEIVLHCPADVQSYLYDGNFWPCAASYTGTSGRKHFQVPKFTPAIHVVPTAVVNLPASSGRLRPHAAYGLWVVRLKEIALLVPKKPRKNQKAPVPARSTDGDLTDWHAIRAEVLDLPLSDPEAAALEPLWAVHGTPVMLDTGSSHSILPYDTCKSIATQWFGVPTDDFIEKPVLSCPESFDADDHDILFTFMDDKCNNSIHFQCTASRFLRTPWLNKDKNGFNVPIIIGKPSDVSRRWILGQNFFWCAFVRFDSRVGPVGTLPLVSSGCSAAVRLAPQRLKDNHGNQLDETAIRFHEDPGRIEAMHTRDAWDRLRYED